MLDCGDALLEDGFEEAQCLVWEPVSREKDSQQFLGRTELTNIADREQVGDVLHVAPRALGGGLVAVVQPDESGSE
ncbi:hypothetical protein E3O53_14445 [Cryobacterium sp. TMT2-18-3]|uniref:hypothetical protein n=1 Tax=unclassified Cryobacterium TaxID=2649013 RepID=UPI00106C34ED|nr:MULTISPECIES: hypothetical protein [unclassified Cryobacterium]TFC24374.1 hypothetical protein E3O22_15645 [Cryobacterium sp. TMT2-18-2]TFC61220.1 hypothetical protein E3O53_14445 [Cryobacterium sp. TMT2-18-3]